MCCETKNLNQTRNGFLTYCVNCKIYHLTYGQFYLELNEQEFNQFGIYLEKIDPDYWENHFCSCKMQRKIPIPTLQANLTLMVSRYEVKDVKKLVFFNEKKEQPDYLELKDVDYKLILS